VTTALFSNSASHNISRLLAKLNTRAVHILAKKSSHMLRPVKDDLGLKVSGVVYNIACKCGKVYIGQTGRSIETRCKEHAQHLCSHQVEKSATAEHSTDSGHQNKFQETKVIAKTSGHMDQLVKEVAEIRLHTNNFNREKGFKLSRT
jgi:hypothetical protein